MNYLLFRVALNRSLSALIQLNRFQDFTICLEDTHITWRNEILQFESTTTHVGRSFYLPVYREEVEAVLDEIDPTTVKFDLMAYVAIMAMGGVEWNTIAILSKLSFRSLIVSRFLPNKLEGNLSREALINGIPVLAIFDCQGLHQEYLHEVVDFFCPKLLWICNWSMEDERESSKIYALANKIRFIDQRSYDTREGWIQTINTKMANHISVFVGTNGLISDEIERRVGKRGNSEVKTIRPVLRNNPQFLSSQPTEVNLYQISRLSSQKRIDRGLRMFQELQRLGYHDKLKIVGDGPLSSQLQTEALKISGVEFLGFRKTFDVIGSASALIQSSDFEGLPMVIIEALAAGLPVFATATGDLPWLQKQLSGFECKLLTIASFNDEETFLKSFVEWRKHLTKIWNSPDREPLAKYIRETFNRAKVANEYNAIFLQEGLQNG